MYGKASAGNGYIILIVAECNVNVRLKIKEKPQNKILIVAECNVNISLSKLFFPSVVNFNSSRV